MTRAEIAAVLADHALWVGDQATGARANLSCATLSCATLSDADLSRADLSDATLSGADLSRADLSGADLSDATLSRADLSRAKLSDANLSDANLSGADLSGADLSGADLSDATLSGANLSRATLSGANLSRAILPPFQIVPETGAFRAWKKLTDGIVAEIEIPADASRVSSTGRKCRAERALVLGLYRDGAPANTDRARGIHDRTVEYVVGSSVIAKAWDPDIREECTGGIHFFLRRAEAEAYSC